MLCIVAGARFGEVAVTFFVASSIVLSTAHSYGDSSLLRQRNFEAISIPRLKNNISKYTTKFFAMDEMLQLYSFNSRSMGWHACSRFCHLALK